MFSNKPRIKSIFLNSFNAYLRPREFYKSIEWDNVKVIDGYLYSFIWLVALFIFLLLKHLVSYPSNYKDTLTSLLFIFFLLPLLYLLIIVFISIASTICMLGNKYLFKFNRLSRFKNVSYIFSLLLTPLIIVFFEGEGAFFPIWLLVFFILFYIAVKQAEKISTIKTSFIVTFEYVILIVLFIIYYFSLLRTIVYFYPSTF